MKRTILTIALALVAISAATVAFADPEIIGVPKCKMCHKAKTGDQFKIWSESAHAGAFETLKNEQSAAIAAEKGLGNAWEAPECLKCHTTQNFLGAAINAKAKYDLAEGVGCEACHGAGSDYKSKKIMKDREAALAAGMKLDGESNCVMCHNEESPTFEGFDFAARWEEIKHPVPE